MIGDTAFERKHGGRRLGLIVGQRTATDAEGRPVEEWEIRSGRGIKFFMAKAEVRISHEPEPEPEPEAAVEPPSVTARTDKERTKRIEQEVRGYHSPVPIIVTCVGIAIGLAGLAGLVVVPIRFLTALPLLAGLLITLVGTNLVAAQSRRLDALRKEIREQARDRTPEDTP